MQLICITYFYATPPKANCQVNENNFFKKFRVNPKKI